MPRCMMHGVRGYKKKKYWDNGTHQQNVMMTRSGLIINTIPKSRQKPVQVSASTSTQHPPNPNQKPPENKVKNPPRDKSMNNLSLMTRIALHNGGARLDLGIGKISEKELNANNNNHNIRTSPLALQSISSRTSQAKPQGKIFNLVNLNLVKNKGTNSTESRVNDNSSFTSYSEMQGRFSINNEGINISDVTYDLKNGSTNRYPSIETLKQKSNDVSQLQECNQPKSSLAKRHPVLLRHISRDDVADAAASLLSLASSCPTTPNSSIDDSDLTQDSRSPTTEGSSIGETPLLITVNDRESVTSDTTSISQSTNDDDDTSSVTSQSSSDDTYVQQATQEDETFLKDLTCFQLECHAYAYDSCGNRIHRCTICERVFTVFSAFKTHVNTHVRPKNRCSACGKIFSRSWLLKGHMRTHTGERPYTCKYSGCNKKFADKSNLRSHQLIHTTKDKAFICAKCKRAFAQKRYLHKHELEVCKI